MNGASQAALIRHASLAVERAERIQIQLVRDMDSALLLDGGASLGDVLGCVNGYRESLGSCLAGLRNAPAGELAGKWRAFLVAYDDYLEAVRRARCDLAQSRYWNELRIPLVLPLASV
jgi:hypothetical protein